MVRAKKEAKEFILGNADVRQIIETLPGGKELCEEFEREAAAAACEYNLDAEHEQMAEAAAAFFVKLWLEEGIQLDKTTERQAYLKDMVMRRMESEVENIEVGLRDGDAAVNIDGRSLIKFTVTLDGYDVMAIIKPYSKQMEVIGRGIRCEIDWRNRKVDGLKLEF
ncbi:MAG: hypothetical protein GC136_10250 [Alphaproteobacteria bacterium]|nr:hypothetical protein [Alphaproteobacteria bacterium]